MLLGWAPLGTCWFKNFFSFLARKSVKKRETPIFRVGWNRIFARFEGGDAYGGGHRVQGYGVGSGDEYF